MKCKHCDINGWNKDMSGNRIEFDVTLDNCNSCDVSDMPCICICHLKLDGAKIYDDI